MCANIGNVWGEANNTMTVLEAIKQCYRLTGKTEVVREGRDMYKRSLQKLNQPLIFHHNAIYFYGMCHNRKAVRIFMKGPEKL